MNDDSIPEERERLDSVGQPLESLPAERPRARGLLVLVATERQLLLIVLIVVAGTAGFAGFAQHASYVRSLPVVPTVVSQGYIAYEVIAAAMVVAICASDSPESCM